MPALDTVLIIGGSGQLGAELRQTLSDRNVIAPSHAALPIEDPHALAHALDTYRPDAVINCSAFHQVDRCEAEPNRAFEINATMVGNASSLCAERGIAFATMSTDYVFAGDEGRAYSESDSARPVNVYGVSKLAGEHYAMLANPRAFVFRISGVFGRTGFSNKGPTFPERMISMAERGDPIKVVDNIVFSPTYTVDAAVTICEVMQNEQGGLFHVTNGGKCSWYDLAVESIRAAGLSAHVERTQYAPTPGSFKRPQYSPLAHTELQRRGYAEMPSWQSAVAAYVRERAHRLTSVAG